MSTHTPINEQETIYYFSVRSEGLVGCKIININTSYPDATIEMRGKVYKVEFEYKLSSFIKHGHDPRDCDLIVCWVADSTKVKIPIPVWELSTDSYPEIHKPVESDMNAFIEYMQSKTHSKNWNGSKKYFIKGIETLFK